MFEQKTWVVLIENIKNQHFPQSEKKISFQDTALALLPSVLFYPVIRRRKTGDYIIKEVTIFCSGNLVCHIWRTKSKELLFQENTKAYKVEHFPKWTVDFEYPILRKKNWTIYLCLTFQSQYQVLNKLLISEVNWFRLVYRIGTY